MLGAPAVWTRPEGAGLSPGERDLPRAGIPPGSVYIQAT